MEGGEEFEEEEVWSVLRKSEIPGPEMKMSKSNNLFSASSSSSARYIPKGNEVSAGLKQSSAPMNIPDWSKVYGYPKKSTSSHLHSWAIDDDDDDDEGSVVPPHELVAKRLARTQISSFSMCEGIGRTLKGRDLSKTRNAVLIRTGFLESNITSSSTSPP